MRKSAENVLEPHLSLNVSGSKLFYLTLTFIGTSHFVNSHIQINNKTLCALHKQMTNDQPWST